MCGRFNVTSDPLSQLLMDLVGIAHPGPDNLNLAPTESVQVLRSTAEGGIELVPMRWWLTPFWAKELTTKYAMFNAKSETAAKSPAFKEPFKKRRCVVPISGFYEWCRQQGQKVPYFIVPQDSEGLLLAGLWDRWVNKQGSDKLGRAVGEELLSFTILTTAASESMQTIHHRQPVILTKEDALKWLDAKVPTSELEGLFDSKLPIGLEAIPVSSHVNNARNKDERVVQPLGNSTVLSVG